MPTPSLDTIAAQLERIQKQQRDQVAGNSLNNGVVRDPASGTELPLQQFAFGMRTAQVAEAITLIMNSATWYGGGPDLTVDVATGRLLVIISGRLTASGNQAEMSQGVLVYGPTEYQPSNDRCLSVLKDASDGASAGSQSSRVLLFTDLIPGTYQVLTAYQLQGAVGQPNGISGTASARSLTVWPF